MKPKIKSRLEKLATRCAACKSPMAEREERRLAYKYVLDNTKGNPIDPYLNHYENTIVSVRKESKDKSSSEWIG